MNIINGLIVTITKQELDNETVKALTQFRGKLIHVLKIEAEMSFEELYAHHSWPLLSNCLSEKSIIIVNNKTK